MVWTLDCVALEGHVENWLVWTTLGYGYALEDRVENWLVWTTLGYGHALEGPVESWLNAQQHSIWMTLGCVVVLEGLDEAVVYLKGLL